MNTNNVIKQRNTSRKFFYKSGVVANIIFEQLDFESSCP